MSLNIVALIQESIIALTVFFVFFLCYRIYSKAEGASLAYKCWAKGTFLAFLGQLFYVFFALGISDIFELLKKFIGNILIISGYFYFPVGVMHLSKDLDMGSIDKNIIKKIQTIFLSSVFLIYLTIAILYPFFDIDLARALMFNLLLSFVWVFTLFLYSKIYSVIKSITNNSGWTWLYLGLFAALGNDLFSSFEPFVPVFIILITFRLIRAISFILAFFKISKMLQAN